MMLHLAMTLQFIVTNGSGPTPTITGTSGGTFSSPSGLVIDGTTGTINLSQSFNASSQGLVGYYSFSGNAINDLSGSSSWCS